jgi:hypothetical protein
MISRLCDAFETLRPQKSDEDRVYPKLLWSSKKKPTRDWGCRLTHVTNAQTFRQVIHNLY